MSEPLPAALPSVAISGADLLIGGGRFRVSPNSPMQFALAKIAPDTRQISYCDAPFFPHGIALRAGKSSLAFAFEKIGQGAGLIDLDTLQWHTQIAPVNGRLFYGHGVCSKDDKLLYSTETTPEGTGAIGVRDTNTLQYLGDFPTYGSHPHDCHLIEHGKVLAVSNGGGTRDSGDRAAICFIDVASQRLLERVDMPDDRFNAGHLAPFGAHQVVLVSAPRRGLGEDHLGAVSVRRGKAKLAVANAPAEVVNVLFGESLSVLAIPARDLFIATHPTPGLVTIWQLGTLKLRKVLPLASARGVALSQDKNHAWISFGERAELIRLSLDSLLLDASSQFGGTFLTGSHLLNPRISKQS